MSRYNQTDRHKTGNAARPMRTTSDLEEIQARFSFNLTRLMKQEGRTSQYVCEKLDIQAPKLSRWRNGDAVPRPNQITALAEFFGVDVIEFFKAVPADHVGKFAPPYELVKKR